MISQDHTQAFEMAVDELSRSLPITSAKLRSLHFHLGPTAAFYAVQAIFWLKARVDAHGLKGLKTVTEQEVAGFAYYRYVKNHEDSLRRFETVIQCFYIEVEALHP